MTTVRKRLPPENINFKCARREDIPSLRQLQVNDS